MSPHVASLSVVVGRDEELTQLQRDFGYRVPPVVRVLCGMGGVGKTSLARAYAHRHRDEYQVIWWVRAEDPATIDAEFRDLLQFLLPPGQSTSEIKDARATALSMLSRLSEPWLLVLDNVSEPAAAKQLIPAAGNGHVLITSQATNWPAADVVFPVAPLSLDSSVTLLMGLALDPDEATARELARELDCLPLALAQAGSFVHAHATNLATYLRLYCQRSDDLHQENTLTDYPHPVSTTWHLAMDRLPPTAAAVLNVFAFLAPDAIAVNVLLSANPDELTLPNESLPTMRLLSDELARLRAIRELRAFSLVTPLGGGSVSVHRLIQAVTRTRLLPDRHDEWRATALALVSSAIPPADLVNAKTLTRWKALRTHVHVILDHSSAEQGLTTRQSLAYWTGVAGDPADARDQLDALLATYEHVLGPEHPRTLVTRHNRAYWTGKAADPAGARDQFATLLPIRQRVLGPEHPHTLTTQHNLAQWTGKAGDPTTARDELAALLSIRQRVLGPEHPDTLTTQHEVAYWTGAGGDQGGARDRLVTLLSIYERVLGPEHPDTLMTRWNLARWTGKAGDPAGARDQFRALFPIYERVFGPEYTYTLTARHNLAHWIGKAGDPTVARDQLAALLPICERVLGPEHSHTRNTRQALEYWTDQAR